MEGAASTDFAFHPDLTFMGLNAELAEGEAKAGRVPVSLLPDFGLAEFLEYLPVIIVRNSRPVIIYGKARIGPLPLRPQ
jgi:hypothetical protein